MPYLQPFFDLKPQVTNITMVPWNLLYASLFFGTDSTSCEDNLHLNSAGQGLRQTDVATWETFFADLTDFLRRHPEIDGSCVASRFPNQAVLAVPDEDTAYPYRDIKTHLYVHVVLVPCLIFPPFFFPANDQNINRLFENIYPNNSTLDQIVDSFVVKARKTFQPTSGYDNLTMYINYGHGDEGPGVWYSPQKLGRLTRLKREWDPNQLFSWNNPLPLHWP